MDVEVAEQDLLVGPARRAGLRGERALRVALADAAAAATSRDGARPRSRRPVGPIPRSPPSTRAAARSPDAVATRSPSAPRVSGYNGPPSTAARRLRRTPCASVSCSAARTARSRARRRRRGARSRAASRRFWLPNIFGIDAITAAALAGREVARIELGTAVVPTYPRHPVALAQQALTAAAATGGRFTLGIGLSHKIVIEDMFGLDYSKPARHMREYLEVLTPLLRGEPVEYRGSEYRVKAGLDVPGGAPVPLRGRRARPRDARPRRPARRRHDHLDDRRRARSRSTSRPRSARPRATRVAPSRASSRACRSRCAATRPRRARRSRRRSRSTARCRPTARCSTARARPGPPTSRCVGDEAALRAQLGRLRDAGVTDFDAAVTPVEEGSEARTLEFLASLR